MSSGIRPSRACSGRSTVANGSSTLSPFTVAGMKFIGGDPMKPATKRLTGCSYSSRGVASCCRMPRFSTATRSPSVIASVWSWVTYTVVMPIRFCSREISVRIWPRSFASRLESGSSNRNAFASRTIARPMATRCRWPPERLPGLRSRCSSSSSVLEASRTFSSISSSLNFFERRSGNAMFS